MINKNKLIKINRRQMMINKKIIKNENKKNEKRKNKKHKNKIMVYNK